MKKGLLMLCLFLVSVSLTAQDFVSTFLGKFGEDNQLEVVTIGKKMLELLGAMDSQGKEFAEVLSGLESIRIVSSNDTALNKEYYEIAHQMLTKKNQGFEELLSVQEPEERLVIMVKQNKGAVRELVLLTGGEKEQRFSMITLNGKIDLEKLVKYSKDLNVKGLDKLDVIRNKE